MAIISSTSHFIQHLLFELPTIHHKRVSIILSAKDYDTALALRQLYKQDLRRSLFNPHEDPSQLTLQELEILGVPLHIQTRIT